MGRIDKRFTPFEGAREPYPIAIVRIAFFAGLLVHFAPSLLWLDVDNVHPTMISKVSYGPHR